MTVVNTHTRIFSVAPDAVVAIINTLATSNDRLWPHEYWPPMILSDGLQEGSIGGHRPIQYVVKEIQPDQLISFEFLSPRGFVGTHSFEIKRNDDHSTQLRHTINITTRGVARILWPLIIRPLHNALLTDAMHKVSTNLGIEEPPPTWSIRVRILRWLMSGGQARSRQHSAMEKT